jgi:hypothetical protein
VKFDSLTPTSPQSAECLTCLLWTIAPEDRAANLGEIMLNGSKSELNVTTELQVFGLVVTAEPYYAPTQPSDLIVMENVVRAKASLVLPRALPSARCGITGLRFLLPAR